MNFTSVYLSDVTHFSFWNSNSFWYYTRPEQAQFIHSPVLFEPNRIKNFHPSNWHREQQIVYVKADLVRYESRLNALFVEGMEFVPGGG